MTLAFPIQLNYDYVEEVELEFRFETEYLTPGDVVNMGLVHYPSAHVYVEDITWEKDNYSKNENECIKAYVDKYFRILADIGMEKAEKYFSE